MRSQPFLVPTLLVLLATLAGPAAAQWKWRDAAGVTHYSDQPPPPSVPDRNVLQRPGSSRQIAAPLSQQVPLVPREGPLAAATAASAASQPARTVDPALEAKRKAQEEADAAKKKAEEAKVAAAKADNCNRAKGQMKALDDGIRIARTNAKGEREILDDKARAEESKRTKQVIAADCK